MKTQEMSDFGKEKVLEPAWAGVLNRLELAYIRNNLRYTR